MEKRLILAVLLMSATIMVTNLLFPPAEPPATGEAPVPAAEVAQRSATARPVLPAPVPAPAAAVDTVPVVSPLYRLAFSTRGAALVGAEMREYPSYTREGSVQLVPEGGAFLTYRLAVGSDTLELSTLPFRATARSLAVPEGSGERSIAFEYGQADGLGVRIEYVLDPERYVIGVRGRVSGVPAGAVLLTELGPGLMQHEAPDHHGEQQLAAVTRSIDGVDRIPLRKLQGVALVERPLTWAGIKDKYFLAAVIAGDSTPLSGARVYDLPDTRQEYEDRDDPVPVPQARLVAALPIGPEGDFAFSTYVGPQDFERLSAVGYDLENVTQYAYRWLEPIIRPVAAAILWVLDGMHDALGLAYGWVLVIFGVLMRIVLWPLNTKAMRAQLKNMAIQPLMQEIREKYKKDPERQQAEMMKLVKEHGFNPLAGCLPLLIPFPVLITLFFVFQNTIAFRGAEFLWLPDLSLRDPLYILPLFLMISMFALQWISAHTSGMEQNPQMKMMMYFMPLAMGALFFTLPAGLNLYYATTNVASIPQQILIGRERKRAKVELEKTGPKPAPSTTGPAARGRRRARGR